MHAALPLKTENQPPISPLEFLSHRFVKASWPSKVGLPTVRVRFSFCPGLVKDSVRPRGDPPENVNGGARFASVDRPIHAGIDV